LPGTEAGFLPGAADGPRAWVQANGGLCFIDLDSGEQTGLQIGPRQRVFVKQTRRGFRIVVWVGNNAFDLLDEAGQVLRHMETPGAKEPVRFAVSPDGTRLAFPLPNDEVQRVVLCDVASGRQTAVCAGHRRRTYVLAFSPDGRRLATGGKDPEARLWDAASGALAATCRGHTSRILWVEFSPDGARLMTASSDETVRQWDAATGQEVEAPYDRHRGEVSHAVYSPDGEWVASTGMDRTIRLWRTRGRRDMAILNGHTGAATDLAVAAGGRRLATLSSEVGFWGGDGTIRVWGAGLRATLPVLRGHTRAVYPVAYSPVGRWIASGSWDGWVRLWDAATGEPCAKLPNPGFVQTLAYGPDGSWLAAGNLAENRLRIWDVAAGRIRQEIQVPGGTLWFVSAHPDGQRLALTVEEAQSKKHRLQVCDLASGELVFSAEGKSLGYSPDGRWLAALAADGKTVLLLNARTHVTAARLTGHAKTVNSAAFGPHSRCLASCSADRTVRLWDTAPLKARYQARRETEAARPEAERLVKCLFAELREPAVVFARLRDDGS